MAIVATFVGLDYHQDSVQVSVLDNAWMFVEPLGGWRSVRVTQTKKAVDWAHQVKQLVDDSRFAEADRITLVCDNLNTHNL